MRPRRTTHDPLPTHLSAGHHLGSTPCTRHGWVTSLLQFRGRAACPGSCGIAETDAVSSASRPAGWMSGPTHATPARAGSAVLEFRRSSSTPSGRPGTPARGQHLRGALAACFIRPGGGGGGGWGVWGVGSGGVGGVRELPPAAAFYSPVRQPS